jgi:hypothetical protein
VEEVEQASDLQVVVTGKLVEASVKVHVPLPVE